MTDILSELTRQLGPLERRSGDSQDLFEEGRRIKTSGCESVSDRDGAGSAPDKRNRGKQDTAENQLKDLQQQFEKTKEEYERLEKNLEELEGGLPGREKLPGRMLLHSSRWKARSGFWRNRFIRSVPTISIIRTEKMRYGKNFCTAGKEMESCLQQKEELLRQLDEVQGQQKEQKETVEKLQQEASFYAEQAESAKNEIIEILNRRASTKGKLQRYDAMLEQIQIRKAELASRQLQMKGDENRQTETLKNYQAEYEAVSRKMEGRERNTERSSSRLRN